MDMLTVLIKQNLIIAINNGLIYSYLERISITTHIQKSYQDMKF